MKTVIYLLIILTSLSNSKLFSTTANPQQKPCEPPCCEKEKRTGRVIYFCGPHQVKCNYICKIRCIHPEGIGIIYLDCGELKTGPENKCYRLRSGFTYEGCLNPDPDEPCPPSHSSICSQLCYTKLPTQWTCGIEAIIILEVKPLFNIEYYSILNITEKFK